MKRYCFLVVLIFFLNSSFAQNLEANFGPYLESYGKFYEIENADLQLEKNIEYKVIFDVYTDDAKKGNTNPLIATVARFLNMHGKQGVPLENMKLVVILHGSATKSALNSNGFNNHYKADNPNLNLLNELKKAGVTIYVCGQSYLAYGYKFEEKSDNVKMSLSALTALVHYQNKGYKIINFN